MNKPTVPMLDWTPGNDPAKVIEPSPSKKNDGWNPNEPLPAQNMNWFLYSIDQWLRYLVSATDVSIGQVRSVLGTSAQVAAGTATHDDPQDAYDAAVAAGGGVMLVLNGSMPGNLAMNDSTGVIVQGLGYQSEIVGNVTLSSPRNAFLNCRIGGNVTLSSSDCFLDNVWLAFTSVFTNSSPTQRNFYRVTGGTNGLYMSHPGVGGAGVDVIFMGPFDLSEVHHGKVMLVDLTSGPIQVNLPTARKNFMVTFKDHLGAAFTNNLTIQPAGGAKIENLAAPYVMQTNFAVKTLICDGTDWNFI